MEDRILEIMREVFDDATVDTSCSQSNCEKWDSLHHLTLISDLEDEFDVEFEPEEIAQMRDFNAVRDVICSKS
ncbi:MAG: acyl carrier protein [Muribaculaceae bacterium]|nr:acyl carrier protein [Muribaculaceae bacterium]